MKGQLPTDGIWEKLLSCSKMAKVTENYCKKISTEDLSLEDFTDLYFSLYTNNLRELALSRFSNKDSKLWFNRLKAMTKYDSFSKRDGSIAKCCKKNG